MLIILNKQRDVDFEIAIKFCLGAMHKLLENGKLPVHRNKYCLQPISQQRKSPRVYLLSDLRVVVRQIHVSRVRSLEPNHVFLLDLVTRLVQCSHLRLLDITYPIYSCHLGCPYMLIYYTNNIYIS